MTGVLACLACIMACPTLRSTFAGGATSFSLSSFASFWPSVPTDDDALRPPVNFLSVSTTEPARFALAASSADTVLLRAFARYPMTVFLMSGEFQFVIMSMMEGCSRRKVRVE